MKSLPVLQIFYDKETNTFLDECGFEFVNVFEAITPNDLILYRSDPGFSLFYHRDIPGLLCEILELEDWNGDVYHGKIRDV